MCKSLLIKELGSMESRAKKCVTAAEMHPSHRCISLIGEQIQGLPHEISIRT